MKRSERFGFGEGRVEVMSIRRYDIFSSVHGCFLLLGFSGCAVCGGYG